MALVLGICLYEFLIGCVPFVSEKRVQNIKHNNKKYQGFTQKSYKPMRCFSLESQKDGAALQELSNC